MYRLRVMLVMAASCALALSESESAMAQYYGGYPSGYGGYGYGSPVYSNGVGLGVYGAHSSWGIGVPSGSYYGRDPARLHCSRSLNPQEVLNNIF